MEEKKSSVEEKQQTLEEELDSAIRRSRRGKHYLAKKNQSGRRNPPGQGKRYRKVLGIPKELL